MFTKLSENAKNVVAKMATSSMLLGRTIDTDQAGRAWLEPSDSSTLGGQVSADIANEIVSSGLVNVREEIHEGSCRYWALNDDVKEFLKSK